MINNKIIWQKGGIVIILLRLNSARGSNGVMFFLMAPKDHHNHATRLAAVAINRKSEEKTTQNIIWITIKYYYRCHFILLSFVFVLCVQEVDGMVLLHLTLSTLTTTPPLRRRIPRSLIKICQLNVGCQNALKLEERKVKIRKNLPHPSLLSLLIPRVTFP